MTANVASLERGIAKVRRLWRQDRYDLALVEVDRLLELSPNNPYLLVQRGELIQLQNGDEELPTLEDAKAALVSAVALDPDSPNALIELGYFVYAIEDDAKTAAKHFEKAVKLSADLFAQALVGHAEALSELGQETKAARLILEARTIASQYTRQMT